MKIKKYLKISFKKYQTNTTKFNPKNIKNRTLIDFINGNRTVPLEINSHIVKNSHS